MSLWKRSAKNAQLGATGRRESRYAGQTVKVFGIRHHGVGCARALVKGLDEFRPDCVLVEGPSDATSVFNDFVGNPDLRPPFALQLYIRDDPKYVLHYPFVSFSPEWVSARLARSDEFNREFKCEFRFIDVPSSFFLEKQRREEREKELKRAEQKENDAETAEVGVSSEETSAEKSNESRAEEPGDLFLERVLATNTISTVGKLVREVDPELIKSENWSDETIEDSDEPLQHLEPLVDLIAAVRSKIRLLRENRLANNPSLAQGLDKIVEENALTSGCDETFQEVVREAHMRREVRKALDDGFKRVAVVCGAWHAPVINPITENEERACLIPNEQNDEKILRSLASVEVEASLTPWTYKRISSLSYGLSYGARIESPGWFEAVWVESREAARLEEICTGSYVKPQPAINDFWEPSESKSNANTSAPRDFETESINAVARYAARGCRFLRSEGLSVSPATTVDVAKLAVALAKLDGRRRPNRSDARDAFLVNAAQSNSDLMDLVTEALEVGDAIGSIPNDPRIKSALSRDIELQAERLGFELSTREKKVELGLFESPRDMERSRFLHRLRLLEIDWGNLTSLSIPWENPSFAAAWKEFRDNGDDREWLQEKKRITEKWTLEWDVNCVVKATEANQYGTTVEDAALKIARKTIEELVKESKFDLAIKRFGDAIASGYEAQTSDYVIALFEDAFGKITDVDNMLGSYSTFANVGKQFAVFFGAARDVNGANVGNPAFERIGKVLETLLDLTLKTLPNTCFVLSKEAASKRVNRLCAFVNVLFSLRDDQANDRAFDTFEKMVNTPGVNPQVCGLLTSMLFRAGRLDPNQRTQLFKKFINNNATAEDVSDWLTGFLYEPRRDIVNEHAIWQALDMFFGSFADNAYFDENICPLMRRAFQKWSTAQRRSVGEFIETL